MRRPPRHCRCGLLFTTAAPTLHRAPRVSFCSALGGSDAVSCSRPLQSAGCSAVSRRQQSAGCSAVSRRQCIRMDTGFLSGKYRTAADAAKSPRGEGVVAKFLNKRGLRILRALDDVGRRYGASPATVALAWQIARPSITAPIASATTVAQLAELVAATQLNLNQMDIEQLNTASG